MGVITYFSADIYITTIFDVLSIQCSLDIPYYNYST